MRPGPDETAPTPPVRGRSTRQKTAVNAALDELQDFVSAQELFALLKERGEQVSLATVYRILQQQQRDGLVDVLNPDDGESLFRRCAARTHHHHLVCRQCGRAVEIEAPAVEQWTTTVAGEHGFSEVEHTVEIYGICPDCSRSRACSGAQSGSISSGDDDRCSEPRP